ncbi:hypothetical protein BH09ACT8_BH09ACT8_62420 [soil metagenome]
MYARKIVGWKVASEMTQQLVTDAINQAIDSRKHSGTTTLCDLVHHSDAGAQYTSTHLTERLSLEHVAASIGSVGDAYDNALIESANGLYKTECIRTTIFHAGPYKTIADVEFATAAWVDWYNNSRLHSSIGLIPPNEFETIYYAALTPRNSPQWRRHETWGDSSLLTRYSTTWRSSITAKGVTQPSPCALR